MIIVFDLDDVLYEEISYVYSGLEKVAEYIQQTHKIPKQKSISFIHHRLKKSREKILDDLLINFGIYKKNLLKKCLMVYRKHNPNISLYVEAKKCLLRLHKYPTYIVTDGNRIVQKNKLLALGLYDIVKKCYLTSNYGLKNAKPSPYCFFKISKKENILPEKIIYVGDNPYKDFIGIKPYGFKTVRLKKGRYKKITLNKKHEAEYSINSLNELNEDFLQKITNSS